MKSWTKDLFLFTIHSFVHSFIHLFTGSCPCAWNQGYKCEPDRQECFRIRYHCDSYNHILQSLYSIRKVSALYYTKVGRQKDKASFEAAKKNLKIQVQLTLKQHGSERRGSTYVQIFFNKNTVGPLYPPGFAFTIRPTVDLKQYFKSSVGIEGLQLCVGVRVPNPGIGQGSAVIACALVQ